MALSPIALTETAAFTEDVYPPQPNSAIEADDVGAGLLALANRTKFLGEKLYYRHPTPVTSTSPSYSAVGTSFTTIDLVQFADPATEEVEVGDVIEFSFTCTANATTEAGLLALFVREDGGSLTEITGARVRIPATGEDVAVCLVASHVVTTAGTFEAAARGAKAVLGGSLDVVEAYRIEARRIRRSAS